MIAQSVAEIISRHVRLTVEGIDRMYLNVFVPDLQYEQGIVHFFRTHRGQPLPSAALMSPVTRSFVAKLDDFVAGADLPLVPVGKDNGTAPAPCAWSGAAMALARRRSMAVCGRGCVCSRIRSQGRTVKPATATISRSCRPSSH